MALLAPGIIPIAQAFATSVAAQPGGGSLLSGNTAPIMLFGDSLEAQNNLGSNSANAEECSNNSRGYLNWARVYDPRGNWVNWWDSAVTGRFWSGYNQGFSGDQLSDMLARTSAITTIPNANQGVVFVGGGTNSINALTSLATMQTQAASIYSTFRSAGITVVILTVPPRALSGTNSWASGSAQRLLWDSFTAWQVSYASANGYPIIRRDTILSIGDADKTPITSPQPVLQTDNLHVTPYGGYLVAINAAGIIPCLASRVGAYSNFPSNPVTGELFPNPTFTGTGGSKGSGVTGNIADSLNCTVSGTGVSVVGSKTAAGQVLSITTTGAGSTGDVVRLGITSATITPPAAGTWLRCAAKIKTPASTVLTGANPLGRGQPSGSNILSYGLKPDTPNSWGQMAVQDSAGNPVWLQAPDFQVRTDTTGLISQVYIGVDGTTTGSVDVTTSEFHLWPVPDPTF